MNFEKEFCICKGDNQGSIIFIFCNILIEHADLISNKYFVSFNNDFEWP